MYDHIGIISWQGTDHSPLWLKALKIGVTKYLIDIDLYGSIMDTYARIIIRA